MKNEKLLLATLLIVSFGAALNAQKPTAFSMNGLGRSFITSNGLSGNIMEGDSKTHNVGVGGYNLFDLQNNLSVDSAFQAMATYRIRSEFGAFYGSNNSFKFRQFKIMGKLKHFNYEIGDVRIELTPFTMFNFGDMYHKYEGEIFQRRRSISEYENLNIGNGWLLQGAHLQYKKEFENNAVGAYGFVTRTTATNEMSVSDRLLSGGRLAAHLGTAFKFGATYVGLTNVDIASAQYSYKNYVGTGDVEYVKNGSASVFKTRFEGGVSSFTNKKVVPVALDDSAKSYADYFLDLTLHLALKKSGLKVVVNVVDVGPYFSSPTAQTRRVVDTNNPSLFGSVNNASVLRSPILFDRMASEQMYNSKISYVLTPFLNQYNNAQPYGKATPNRMGASIALASDTALKNVDFEIAADYLKELVGEGVNQLRSFMVIKGGAKISLGKMLGWSRKFEVSVGARMEKTNRAGSGKIDLGSTVADAGLSFEIVKKLDVLFGYKMLNANGNEFSANRNAFNTVTTPIGLSVNSSESIASAGLQLRFTTQQAFSLHYNLVSYTNNLASAGSYNISQLLLSYTGTF